MGKLDNFMERRLQTQFYRMGLARSAHHSRVLIRQRHIRVDKQIVNVPSFMVRTSSAGILTTPSIVPSPATVNQGVRRNKPSENKREAVVTVAIVIDSSFYVLIPLFFSCFLFFFNVFCLAIYSFYR